MPAASARTVHRRLEPLADPARAAGVARFFKTGPGEYGEGDQFLGIRVPDLRKVAREFRDLPLSDVTRLLASPWHEERLVALLILVRQYATGTPSRREAIYRLYMKHLHCINNWDLVDASAEHIVGAHLYAGRRVPLRRMARSPNVWERRIAMIATFHHIKRGRFAEPLRVAGWLLNDPHDLIHKAAGWMLREIGKRNLEAEERFLARHAAHMPRTMLRYALEGFSERRRRRYLAARGTFSAPAARKAARRSDSAR
jgi:3-methyladenine DNA glycosylase AlkD